MKQKNIQPHTKQEQGAKSAKVDKVSSRYGVRVYFYTNLLAWTLVLLLIGNYAFGWTIPTSNPPGGDLSAPLDVSSTAQTKAGDLTIDGLLKVGRYSSAPIGSIGALYFDTTADEFKGYKSTGWDSIGGGIWTQSGTDIYYNTGNVGIGTTAPSEKLEVSGNIKLSGASPTYKITNVAAPTASSDVATKEYVDAAYSPLYITTTRGTWSSTCTYPTAFCPSGWAIVTSWTNAQKVYSTSWACWTETLCSK